MQHYFLDCLMDIAPKFNGPRAPFQNTSPETFYIDQDHTAFQGHFRLSEYLIRHARFDGSITPPLPREVFERGHAAGVLPYDPVRDELVLIEQFRPGAMSTGWYPWSIEIIAGGIKAGESYEDVAIRECVEECGLTPTALLPIAQYLISPGANSETIQVFLGRVDSRSIANATDATFGVADEQEDIRAHILKGSDVRTALKAGWVNNALLLIALQWFVLNQDDVKQQWG
jgi:ADP-ribose pyrophosphatase